MHHSAEMRRCLVDVDVAAARKLWHHIAPKAPAPKDDTEALTMLHYARTKTATINLRHRSYSHYWLLERGLPSGLPDNLKPKAARLYPHVFEAVGISVNTSGLLRPMGHLIRRAMEEAVYDCFADNKRDPVYVWNRMQEMRMRTKKKIHGIISEAAERDLRSKR